jgi:hypothetical protein
MKTQINEFTRRTHRYWMVDGLAEIAIGGLFLLISLVLLASTLLTPGLLQALLPALGLPLFIIGGSRIMSRLLDKLKARTTYPRTGFVAYPPRSAAHRRIIWSLGAGLTLILLAFVAIMGPSSQTWMPLLDGLLLGLVLLFVSQGVPRFYLLSGLAFLVGLLLSLGHAGGDLGHGLFYGIMGLLLIISGSLTFRSYLRRNPLVEDGDHETNTSWQPE